MQPNKWMESNNIFTLSSDQHYIALAIHFCAIHFLIMNLLTSIGLPQNLRPMTAPVVPVRALFQLQLHMSVPPGIVYAFLLCSPGKSQLSLAAGHHYGLAHREGMGQHGFFCWGA